VIKKLYVLITSVFILGFFLFYSLYFKKNTQTSLVVGMMNGWAPFMTINSHGEMEGFDVDVVKAIEKVINQPIIIKDLGSLSSLFIALEQGTVDAIFSGLDVTEKRKKEYDFVIYESDKTRFNKYCCVTSSHGPHNEFDLKNKLYIVGVESGLSWEATLDQYVLLDRKYMSSVTDMVLQLEQDKIDCFVLEQTQCNRLKKAIPDLDYFVLDMDPSLSIDGIGIFMKKNNIKLKNNLQHAIDILFRDNKIDPIVKKWNLV
jgi:ABC-type amino acid transport substrate-binding protein